MANYLPKGWQMSRDGAQRYVANTDLVEAVVKQRMRKYNKGIPGHSPEDLAQEARLMAAYAVDTYSPERGSLKGYIGTVVCNGLAMVAAEALAQRRQSHTWVIDNNGNWIKQPVNDSELTDVIATTQPSDGPKPMDGMLDADQRLEKLLRNVDGNEAVNNLALSADAQAALRVRLSPSPELLVMARNLNGGTFRLNAAIIADHLGWTTSRYNRAVTELNRALESDTTPAWRVRDTVNEHAWLDDIITTSRLDNVEAAA